MSEEPREPPSGQPPGGWLPPETPPPPPPGQGPPQPPPPYGQPPYSQPPYSQPPYPQQQPYSAPSQYGQYDPYGQRSPWAASSYTYAEPDNTPATAGFITSITSLGLLLISFGILSPLTLFGSIAGIFVSRNGQKKVEYGETTKNKDLAAWGFWLGVAGAALALLAIAVFIAIVAAAPEWLDELDDTDAR